MINASNVNGFGLVLWIGSVLMLAVGMYAKNPGLMLYGLVGIGFSCFPFALEKHLRKGGSLPGFFVTFSGGVATLSVVALIWFLSLMARVAAPVLH